MRNRLGCTSLTSDLASSSIALAVLTIDQLFFRLHRFAPACICSWILSEFRSAVDNCWIGRKSILFRHPTASIWLSSPFAVQLSFVSSGNIRRLCSFLTFCAGPHTSEWIRSSLLWLRFRSMGNGSQCCFQSWQASQISDFRPLNFGNPNTTCFDCRSWSLY